QPGGPLQERPGRGRTGRRAGPGGDHRPGHRFYPDHLRPPDAPRRPRAGQRAGSLPHPPPGGRRPVQRAGEFHLHDAAPPLTSLEAVADALGAVAGARVRLWRYDGRGLRRFGPGPDAGFVPPIPMTPGLVPTPTGSVWLAPVLDSREVWVELAGLPEARARELAPPVAGIGGRGPRTEP